MGKALNTGSEGLEFNFIKNGTQWRWEVRTGKICHLNTILYTTLKIEDWTYKPPITISPLFQSWLTIIVTKAYLNLNLINLQMKILITNACYSQQPCYNLVIRTLTYLNKIVPLRNFSLPYAPSLKLCVHTEFKINLIVLWELHMFMWRVKKHTKIFTLLPIQSA